MPSAKVCSITKESKRFFVLVNKIRPNEDGANEKDVSRFHKGNQIIILGSEKEAKDVFVNNLNPCFGNIHTAHFCLNMSRCS
jgi:hypothetical protein